MNYILSLILACILGISFGLLISVSIVSGFAEMIMSSILNLYYAATFFIVGSYYTYKIIKKNQIQMSLENEAFIVST